MHADNQGYLFCCAFCRCYFAACCHSFWLLLLSASLFKIGASVACDTGQLLSCCDKCQPARESYSSSHMSASKQVQCCTVQHLLQSPSVIMSSVSLSYSVEVHVLFVTKLHSTHAYLDVLHNMYWVHAEVACVCGRKCGGCSCLDKRVQLASQSFAEPAKNTMAATSCCSVLVQLYKQQSQSCLCGFCCKSQHCII